MLRVNTALRAVAHGWLHRCRRGAECREAASLGRRIKVAHSQYYGWAPRTAPPSPIRPPKPRNIVRCRHGTAPSKARIETRARPLARLSEALDRHRDRGGRQQGTRRDATTLPSSSKLAMHQALRCKARSKRTGKPCQSPAVRGWAVCRMHGARGGAPKGEANGNYKTRRTHGRDSRSEKACPRHPSSDERGRGDCLKPGRGHSAWG